MKRLGFLAVAAVVFGLLAGSTLSYAQGTFKIPYRFQAGGKKFPAGEYWIAQKEKGRSRPKEPGGEKSSPLT
jgi:hypothetical protein